MQAALVRALPSCSTEADVVQLLYAHLHPAFGYDPINLHVLEREGWYHSRAVDRGLLQDVRRRRLSESIFASSYSEPQTLVSYPTPNLLPREEGRGPGVHQIPLTVIWIPVRHRDQVIGAVIYQLYVRREVPRHELALLEEVHAHLGVVVANAYLNELTRNQAMSLSALNQIARALSATRDEPGIVAALRSTLGPLLPVDELELVVPDSARPGQLRNLRAVSGAPIREQVQGSRRLAAAREVLEGGRSVLVTPSGRRRQQTSEAWVPVKEGPAVSAALAVRSRRPDAYEHSTLLFLQQVADQVGLALRHAWSYSTLEAQREHLEVTNRMLEDHRRRLEVVDSVGRRLASCLDRRSIMRTLRRELSRHVDFDVFSLATVTETREGPQAEGYVDDSGRETVLAALPLSAAGPARQAYETGRAVLIEDSPWAQSLESVRRGKRSRVFGEGVVLDVTRPDDHGPVAARSILWVPVRHGQRTTALLSLQAYRAGVFSQWHMQLVQDLAAHVSLALSTAEHFRLAESERRRLEALHVLEAGAAGATDERQVAEATFRAIQRAMRTSNLLLVYLGAQGQATGYGTEAGGPLDSLAPKPAEQTHFFQRLLEEGVTIVEGTPPEQRQQRPGLGWPSRDKRMPAQVVWVPIRQGERVVGGLSAQRYEDVRFTQEEVDLLESAAPVVGIALRTVRLHRANELALRHSVRIQEVAALAGHDLQWVVTSVAEQARSMLVAAGAACWALAEDGRITAQATAGDGIASRVLSWAGMGGRQRRGASELRPVIGRQRRRAWSLVPLYYADHLVGALGFVQPQAALDDSIEAPTDFARHAAIAIENARLAAETRGRIHTLEAVASFADLDIARPSRARAEMGRLVEWALAGSNGTLWLLEGAEMVRAAGQDSVDRLRLPYPHDRTSRGRAANIRACRAVVRGLHRSGVIISPILLEGQLVGMLTAQEGSASSTETRRLMVVVASQAALVLRRLRLVAALNSQARTMAAILTHSPVGVVLEDAAGRIRYANPVIERIYGVPAGSLPGAAAEQLLSRAGASLLVDPDARPGAPAELRIGEKTVQLRRVVIPSSDDEGAGVLTLHEDITEEKAALDAKDLMLRAIGHEVRSPAAAMRATIASLLQWEQVIDPGQRRELMEKAYEQSERLLDLVEAQLTIAKLEGGGFEPKPVEVSLAETLEQVRQVLGSRYGPRVDAVTYRLPARLGNASCEPAHLEQALTNLIGNGLEHSWATRILVTAREEGDWMEVSVEDDGRGLPRDRMDVLFSRPAAAGQHRARGGLGLGLYLCRLIVERSFGGRIWLEKTTPGCSIFKFTVPAAGRRARRRSPRSAQASAPSPDQPEPRAGR